jgi:hypothetical protein
MQTCKVQLCLNFCVLCEGQHVRLAGVKASMLGHIKKCASITDTRRAVILSRITETEALGGPPKSLPVASNGASKPESKLVAKSDAKSVAKQVAKPVANRAVQTPAVQQFHRQLLRATLSANLPFPWVEDPHVIQAFQSVRPDVNLPTRQRLSGRCPPFVTLRVADKRLI